MFRNRLFIFIIGFVVIVIFALLFVFFNALYSGGSNKITPTPSNQLPEAQSGAAENTNPAAIEKDRRDAAVIQLGQLLPYSGVNFSLFYSYSDNFFTLYINASAKAEGTKEFNSFLKSHGVEDASWIKNLRTTYQKITPAP